MICERCGNSLSDNATMCPTCGTVFSMRKVEAHGQDAHGLKYTPFTPASSHEPSTYQRGYAPGQQRMEYTSFSQEASARPYGLNQFAPGSLTGRSSAQTHVTERALAVEILLSFIGIYGVGWLLSGQTMIGVVLLLCSFFLYWPFMILGTILTLGIGLICLGPIAIACIIVNAFMLYGRMKRKAARVAVMQQSQRLPPVH